MTDKERLYRKYAAEELIKAAQRAYGSDEAWYIRAAVKSAEQWLGWAEKLENERVAREQTEAECAAFDAAMAECASAS